MTGSRDCGQPCRTMLQSRICTQFDFTQTPNPPLVLPECPGGVDTVFPDAGNRSPCQ